MPYFIAFVKWCSDYIKKNAKSKKKYWGQVPGGSAATSPTFCPPLATSLPTWLGTRLDFENRGWNLTSSLCCTQCLQAYVLLGLGGELLFLRALIFSCLQVLLYLSCYWKQKWVFQASSCHWGCQSRTNPLTEESAEEVWEGTSAQILVLSFQSLEWSQCRYPFTTACIHCISLGQ